MIAASTSSASWPLLRGSREGVLDNDVAVAQAADGCSGALHRDVGGDTEQGHGVNARALQAVIEITEGEGAHLGVGADPRAQGFLCCGRASLRSRFGEVLGSIPPGRVRPRSPAQGGALAEPQGQGTGPRRAASGVGVVWVLDDLRGLAFFSENFKSSPGRRTAGFSRQYQTAEICRNEL